jgi:myo-inositol-1(or 4)-monophosphatase
MLSIAIKAARAAGNIINRASLDIDAVRVQEKQSNDYVTEVDLACEKVIIETLLTAYPHHGILAEESGQEHGAQNAEYVWIIDPLDGTRNFMHEFPVYSVSIAMQLREKTELGVIYDPTRNDLFTASRGRGAYLNDRRIRVSKQNELAKAMITTGFPTSPAPHQDRILLMLGEVVRSCANMRRQGSAALDLAYVAAGRSDGFFELGLKPWDVAAGALLVTEAGGLIGNFSGDSNFLHEQEVIAGSARIYAQLSAILSKFSQFAAPEIQSRVDDCIKEYKKISALLEKIGSRSIRKSE